MVSSFPQNMNCIAAKGLANGDIEIHIVDKGQPLCGCFVPAKEAGGAAAVILIGALESLEASKKEASNEPVKGLAVLPLTGIQLEDNPEPGCVTLHLQIGDAHIGFELEPDAASFLGEALLRRRDPNKLAH